MVEEKMIFQAKFTQVPGDGCLSAKRMWLRSVKALVNDTWCGQWRFSRDITALSAYTYTEGCLKP